MALLTSTSSFQFTVFKTSRCSEQFSTTQTYK